MTQPPMTDPVAVAAGPDVGAAWHYGDPYGEQRRLAAGSGIVLLSHRPVVAIGGPDRLEWLHTLTSQHLSGLQPGEGTEALILSPHGHVEHHLVLVATADEVLAHIEPGTADALLRYLQLMVFRSDVTVGLRGDVAIVRGRDPIAGAPAVRRGWMTDSFVAASAVGDLAGEPVGLWADDALRVAAGVPRLGFETDHRTIPHEVGWIGPAVHLDKGCYRGQETVARVQNLGRPPRRLVRLHLDGSDAALPTVGATIEFDGRAVGFAGTSARHFEEGPIALAVLKRTVEPGAELVVDGVAARVDEVLVDG